MWQSSSISTQVPQRPGPEVSKQQQQPTLSCQCAAGRVHPPSASGPPNSFSHRQLSALSLVNISPFTAKVRAYDAELRALVQARLTFL